MVLECVLRRYIPMLLFRTTLDGQKVFSIENFET